MALQDKLVSVLTPVYNGALYLDECIQSVVRQTYDNFEFVIVDNCSTDNSYEIAAAAASADERIRVVRNSEHVGLIPNWNRTLTHVNERASYVKFVHADDWLFDTCIERMVDLAEQDEGIGLVSAYRLEEDRVSLDRLPRDTFQSRREYSGRPSSESTPAGGAFRLTIRVGRTISPPRKSYATCPESTPPNPLGGRICRFVPQGDSGNTAKQGISNLLGTINGLPRDLDRGANQVAGVAPFRSRVRHGLHIPTFEAGLLPLLRLGRVARLGLGCPRSDTDTAALSAGRPSWQAPPRIPRAGRHRSRHLRGPIWGPAGPVVDNG